MIYGATAWSYLDKEVRAKGKMGEVAVEGRWVGFAPNSAAYLVYANGRHYVSRIGHTRVDESNVLVDTTASSDDSSGELSGPLEEAPADEAVASASEEEQPQPQQADTTPVENKLDDLGAPEGTLIDVWWPLDKVWYAGTVMQLRPAARHGVHHRVHYSLDDEKIWHNLKRKNGGKYRPRQLPSSHHRPLYTRPDRPPTLYLSTPSQARRTRQRQATAPTLLLMWTWLRTCTPTLS